MAQASNFRIERRQVVFLRAECRIRTQGLWTRIGDTIEYFQSNCHHMNSAGPRRDVIRRQRYRSTMAQIMAFCMTTPCGQAISLSNADNELLAFIPVQIHRKYAGNAGKHYHLKSNFKIFSASARGQWVHRDRSRQWQSLKHDPGTPIAWWPYQMEIFFALLALLEGNASVTGGFPFQRPVRLSFDVFSELHLNKRLSKQSRRRWFETPLRSSWRHCNWDANPHG